MKSPIKRRLAIAGLTIAAWFIVFETAARLFLPHRDLYVETGRIAASTSLIRTDAFCAFSPGWHQRGAKTVSPQGFISTPEISVEKPPGCRRIVFLGGSSTAGMSFAEATELPDDQTWPWLVTKKLGPGHDFINAAMAGYTTFELYGRLWARCRWYKPDVVVLYGGFNEMTYYCQLDDMSRWRIAPDGNWVPRVAQCAPLWCDPILRPSQAFTYIRLILAQVCRRSDQPPCLKYPSLWRPDEAVDVYRFNLRLIEQAAELMGAELYVAKQATLLVADPNEEHLRRCQYTTDLLSLTYEQQWEAMGWIYRVIDEEIDPDHVIDCTPLSGRLDCFCDCVHPTPLGAEKIAEIVAGRLNRP